MLPEVRSYKQNGSSFHLNPDEVRVAHDGIEDLYSHVTHTTGVDDSGNTVYTAKRAVDFANKLNSLNLSRE